MSNLRKFHSIEQFRHVIRKVREKAEYNNEPLPILEFNGTVKLHGTNAAIGYFFNSPENRWYQSRERIITVEDDNAGFANHMESNREGVNQLLTNIDIFRHYIPGDYIGAVIYGEWCGGNIQKGIALNQLPKMFVIFSIKLLGREDINNTWVTDEVIRTYLHSLSDANIYNIFQFALYNTKIDFSNPELSQNYLKELTEMVEACCPVGKYFGIEGTGEGIVWKCVTPPYIGGDYTFKVKGEKHSASKVKTLAAVDIEKVKSISECVEKIVTESRLEQGISYLQENKHEVSVKSLGIFLKWIANDCIKEEVDTITESGLDTKDICKAVSSKAKQWFMKSYN